MKKGKIITISVLVGFFVLLIILSCTLFNLKKVDIEYLAQADYEMLFSKEDISKAGGFKIGTNLLFTRFDENVAKIEKECPNIKVVKTVKKFPNKLTIYITEREKQFKIQGSDEYYYLFDADLKLLQIVEPADTAQHSQYCEIKGYSLSENLSVGDFLKDDNLKSRLNAIIDGIYAAGGSPMSIMSNITLGKDETLGTEIFHFVFTSGAEMKVEGVNNLENKVYIGLTAYNNGARRDGNVDKGSQQMTAEELLMLKILVTQKSNCITKLSQEW